MTKPVSKSASTLPFILGRGGAGLAIERALALLAVTDPDLKLLPPRLLERGADLPQTLASASQALASVEGDFLPVLFVSNPHALHAPTILAAEKAGFSMVFCEKPSCTDLAQAKELGAVEIPVAVFHGYRSMWGPQTLKQLFDRGDLGTLISVEGRYWQSSAAARAIAPTASPAKGWKGDPKLAGSYDVYLDLGTHWVDLAGYVLGSAPKVVRGWRSYANAESPTRETHVQLSVEFEAGLRTPSVRGFASISKTAHGATNFLEIHLLGTQSSASWNLLSPDEIFMGKGRDRSVVTRQAQTYGALLPAFHGAGWLEGYVEIIRQGLRELRSHERGNYPRLADSLKTMKGMLAVEWQS